MVLVQIVRKLFPLGWGRIADRAAEDDWQEALRRGQAGRRRAARLRGTWKFGASAIVFDRRFWGRRALVSASCESLAAAFFAAPREPAYARKPPRIVAAPAALAREIADACAAGTVTPPDSALALLQDATIAASGIVLAPDGRVIAESLLNTQLWTRFGPFARDTLASPLTMKTAPFAWRRRLSGAPHVLMKQTYDANYGHWLIECLPRLDLVAERFDLARCKFIVSASHGAMQPVYADCLAACGIARDQIVAVGYEPIHVDRLVYPLPMTDHPWRKSRRAIRFLERLSHQLVSGVQGPKRIYVSRNRGTRRRLLNEDALRTVLARHGFTTVHAEALSFADQVRTFSDAEIVVGNYGANLSNVVFAPRGVTLFALTTEFMQDDFFWDLMALKGGTYVSLHGKAAAAAPDLDSDFVIDVDRFAHLLEEIVA